MTKRRHRYNTIQSVATCSGSQLLEIFWTRDGRGESLTASSLKAQQTFLEGVGMVKHTSRAFRRSSELRECTSFELCTTAQANARCNLTDPYFTPEQWQAVQEERHALLKEAHTVASESAEQTLPSLQYTAKEWEKTLVPLCSCKAHESVDPHVVLL